VAGSRSRSATSAVLLRFAAWSVVVVSLFLAPFNHDLITGNMAYTIISGDCFIDGFEDGKGEKMARKLRLKEEDIYLL
jgi:hypothetical protein